MTEWRIEVGDCRDVLRQMPARSVHTVVTSPPYFGLRDYGTGGQIGLEPTPDEFVAALVDVFREVRRVLRDDGTVWLNLGDSYANSPKGSECKGTSTLNGGPEYQHAAHPPGTGPWDWRAAGLKQKDLIGVPWMVAFALRQPWERHVITSVADRAWMGGLFDGEGCVSVVAVPPTTGLNESHSMRLQVRMADTEAVERIVEITGLSRVTYDQHPPSYIAAGQRPAQQWKISGDTAADILADMYPFLTVKRKQAIVGWNLQRLKDGVVTKRGQPVPAENMAKRRLLHDVLRKLNQREPVDIPSWCREPTVETEPGWYLRSDVIWSKNNPMPESVTDRPTKAHEFVFLLSKRATYHYDADAIREDAIHEGRVVKAYGDGAKNGTGSTETNDRRTAAGFTQHDSLVAGRNKRSVWTVATQPYAGAHFATFPPKLIEPCILAGAPERACGECGAPWVRIARTEIDDSRPPARQNIIAPKVTQNGDGTNSQGSQTWGHWTRRVTDGFKPSCQHYQENHDAQRRPSVAGEGPTSLRSLGNKGSGATPAEHLGSSQLSHRDGNTRDCRSYSARDSDRPGVVLDPFAGAGTTGLVALQHGREFVGIELSPEYARMARERIETAVRLGFRRPQNGSAPLEGQLDIFDTQGEG